MASCAEDFLLSLASLVLARNNLPYQNHASPAVLLKKTELRYWLLALLACLLGISSWIAISAIWVELPIITSTLPEGSRLPSYIVVISQLANVGPFVYTALVFRCRRFTSHSVERVTILLILIVGTIACTLLAFVWHYTAYIGGSRYSVGLLVLIFTLSTVDCTSSVTHIPFMSDHWPQFLVAFFLGEGLCGLCASLLALVQDIEKSDTKTKTGAAAAGEYQGKRFSISTYFLLIALLMLLSLASFIALLVIHRRRIRRRKTHQNQVNTSTAIVQSAESIAETEFAPHMDAIQRSESEGSLPPTFNAEWPAPPTTTLNDQKHRRRSSETNNNDTNKIDWPRFLPYGASMAWLSFMAIGVIEVQSFSALPYGREVYLWASIAGQIGSPVGRLLTIVLKLRRLRYALLLNATTTLISAYICVAAHVDARGGEDCTMLGQTLGAVVVIAAWFAFNLTTSIARVSIVNMLQSRGRKSLVAVGVAYQCGALVGSIGFFLIINFTAVLFK